MEHLIFCVSFIAVHSSTFLLYLIFKSMLIAFLTDEIKAMTVGEIDGIKSLFRTLD